MEWGCDSCLKAGGGLEYLTRDRRGKDWKRLCRNGDATDQRLKESGSPEARHTAQGIEPPPTPAKWQQESKLPKESIPVTAFLLPVINLWLTQLCFVIVDCSHEGTTAFLCAEQAMWYGFPFSPLPPVTWLPSILLVESVQWLVSSSSVSDSISCQKSPLSRLHRGEIELWTRSLTCMLQTVTQHL